MLKQIRSLRHDPVFLADRGSFECEALVNMKEVCRLGVSTLLLLLFAGSGFAQSSTITGTITTYAGPPLPVSGTQATTQAIDAPSSVTPDGA